MDGQTDISSEIAALSKTKVANTDDPTTKPTKVIIETLIISDIYIEDKKLADIAPNLEGNDSTTKSTSAKPASKRATTKNSQA